MGTVLEFKSKTKQQIPATFWQQYKDLLRKYYDRDVVERIVAAVLDKEIYETTDEHIRYAAQIYYKYAPEKS
jgi:hypothetical protein